MLGADSVDPVAVRSPRLLAEPPPPPEDTWTTADGDGGGDRIAQTFIIGPGDGHANDGKVKANSTPWFTARLTIDHNY